MVSRTARRFSSELFLGELHTERLGRALRAVAEASSTIDLAREWLRDGAPHGAVVIAERQTRGRGRLGRRWASPSGGLWMSIIARPDLNASRAGRLGIGLGLAAAEAASAETGCAVRLKWPNDLVIGDRKAGGVLVETQVSGEEIGAAVLSLGLNVNVSLADLAEEIRATATSLCEQTGRGHRLEALAARTLEGLEALWPAILGDGAGLAARWRERDMLAGREVVVEAGGMLLRGRADGIDADGALALLAEGEVRKVTAGEVTSVRAVAQ